MKKEKLSELMGEIDDDLLERAAKNSQKPRKKMGAFAKIALVAAVIALAVATALVSVIVANLENNDTENGGANNYLDGDMEDTLTVPIDDVYWNDTRERNGKSYLESENGILWPWNCRAVYNQYTSLKVNGEEYGARSSHFGTTVYATAIGEKIGDFICEGYDYITDERHTLACSAYKIKGVDENRIIAVKYDGHDGHYYPFGREELAPPATLGGLIDSLDLTNNISFTDFYYEQEGGATHYCLNFEKNDELWAIIQKYADTKTDLKYENPWNRKIIGFSLNSNNLGVNNLSLSVNQEGYLITNIEDYGYYYNIGVEAVNEIVEFALKNKLVPLIEETKYLVGRVTEIGEDYIKVDDSIVMKNPEDGIEFTVRANHMNIKRYIISGYLKVGQTVSIRHGFLLKNNYTEINNATDLNECVVTSGGQVLIPE